jgi:hypothetical protein
MPGVRRTLQVVAPFVILSSVASPVVFGGLANGYVARVQHLYPPGSSARRALDETTVQGLRFVMPMSPCYRVRQCYVSALIYAGSNPLCSYWHGIQLQTNGWDPAATVIRWTPLPSQVTCFWTGYRAFPGRPAVLIDSLRAELGIR